jgi:CubicO group peptidase (beta-lactamase class C family)
MRALLFALVAALTLMPAAPAAASDPATAEDYARDYMDRIGAPGLAYAIIRGDRVIESNTWGVDGDGRPVTAATPFLLGSTSKSFTALTVAQLAEAGRVDLDTTAVTYLPWLTFETVTVRQLLTHTSGLPQVWSTGLTDRYDNEPGGLARSVRDLAAVRPHAAPGGRYEYSDANYMILGALVEEVTGETFAANLRRHVLDPLRMTHSAATADEARAAGLTAGHRYYLGRSQRFDTRFDTAGVPYGFLAASLDDLTHYTIAQLGGGTWAGTRILSAENTAGMHTGTADTGYGTYGFGWQNTTLDGVDQPVVWHAGATPDYFSHIVLVPGADLAVVVAANVYGLAMDPVLSAAAFDLARITLGGAAGSASPDPFHLWTLTGLLAIAAVLLAALIWSLTGRARRTGSWARTIGWLVFAGAAGYGAAVLIPSLWKGAGLAKVQLWAPDVGHAAHLVIALSAVLALTRLTTTFVQYRRRPGPAPSTA